MDNEALKNRILGIKTPIEKHILLLKLNTAIENFPELDEKPINAAKSSQRKWIAEISALLKRVSNEQKLTIQMNIMSLDLAWGSAVNKIIGQVLDSIEELKLDLELDGESEIGCVFEKGEFYKLFVALKSIIGQATKEVLIIDPYFNGEAFEAYLGNSQPNLRIRIFANQGFNEVSEYIKKHKSEFGTEIKLRKNKNLHDRVLIIDN
jgi:hypothetical protein